MNAHQVTGIQSSGGSPSLVSSERWLVVLSAVVSLLTVGWLLWYGRYGFDFTDEGHYLNSISNPATYTNSVTLFGFVYQPLFWAVGGGVAGLRQVNILLTVALAWVFGYVVLSALYREQLDKRVALTAAGAFASASLVSLVFTNLWIPTPSYNTLALQALLIAALGFVFAECGTSRKSLLGWGLIGVGGWLAFMAKPTTAAALGGCTIAYLLIAGKLKLRLLMVSFATAAGLLLLSALLIDGSIGGFVARLRGGAALVQLLDGGYSISRLLRIDNFDLGQRGKLLIAVAALTFAASAYLSQSRWRVVAHVGRALSAAIGVAVVAMILGRFEGVVRLGAFQGLLLWAVPSAALLVAVVAVPLGGWRKLSRAQVALILCMLVFPHVYAFGSNGNYWQLAARAGIFWVFAGLVPLGLVAARHRVSGAVLSLGFATQLVSVLLLQSGLETPYRQPQTIFRNDYVARVGSGGSDLVVSGGFGRYLADASSVATNAGFRPGTPVIDLTGQSPGLLFALGASATGQPWMIGGYPGSEKFLRAALKASSCSDVSVAWLLTEPGGPRAVTSDVLSSVGASLDDDYEVVGQFRTADGAGGYEQSRAQYLLKPRRPPGAAKEACVAAVGDRR